MSSGSLELPIGWLVCDALYLKRGKCSPWVACVESYDDVVIS